MSIRVSEDVGAAKLNNSLKCGRVESVGPIAVVVMNQSDVANAVVSFAHERTGVAVYSDKDTAVVAENTGYTGNAVLLNFTGQSLNTPPIVPRSVVVTPATAGLVAYDGGDGFMYVDVVVGPVTTKTLAGKINYFTGALVLNYPVGHAPNGQLNADYHFQDEALIHGGQRNFGIATGLPDDALVIYAAADHKLGARIKVESAASWM